MEVDTNSDTNTIKNNDVIFVKEKNLFKDDIVCYKSQYCLVARVSWDHDNLDVDDDDDDEDDEEESEEDSEESESESEGDSNVMEIEDSSINNNNNNNDKIKNAIKKSGFYSTDDILKMNQDIKDGVLTNKEYLDIEDLENDDFKRHSRRRNNNDDDNDNDSDDEYDYYDFKNNESGVLLLVISSNQLIEVDYNEEELQIFDRHFYLTDSVQKINSDSKLLGSVIKCQKTYFVVPFSTINTGIITQGDLTLVQKVYDPSTLVVGSKVFDSNKIAAGLVTKVVYDLECLDVNNNDKIVKIKRAESLNNVFLHKIYNDDDSFCPGKIVFSKSKKKLVINKVIPVEAEIEWLYFFKNDCDYPNSIQPIDKIIKFSDDYETFSCGEPIVYIDKDGEEKGGYLFLTKSIYTVAWQDGEFTQEDSVDLMICDSLATDYFPGQVVCTSGMDVANPYSNKQSKWGVVISTKPTDRVCSINWNNIVHEDDDNSGGSSNNNNNEDNKDSTLIIKYLNDNGESSFIENDVSVYDIEYLEEYNFDESDYVCKLDDSKILKEADIIGQVIGRDGLQLKIKWNNGFIEMVYPFELTKVDDFDDSDSEDEEDDDEYYDDDDDDRSSFSEYCESSNSKEQEDTSETEKEIKKVIKKIEDEEKEKLKPIQQQQQQIINKISIEEKEKENQNENEKENIENINENNNNYKIIDNDKELIKNTEQIENGCIKFEILKEFEIHNFIEEKSGGSLNKKFLNTISKEFEILSTSMPPGIFVKANSTKIQLLSALIIGPQDTIYENSIFIFDIYLPNQYPMVPPKVFYHSVSFKLHPNLNVNGTVCLSLLGTWHGNKNELWIPEVSNLLQVLISIQGLILGCKEPYFLEAGYDTQIGTHIGIRNSSIFNEDSYLLSLETICFYLKNQPILFKDIIQNHFKLELPAILNRIDQFLNQNNQANNGIKSLFCINLPPSQGFLTPLKKLKNKIQEYLK
ncbi:hypothetical protein DDB_G0290629 [Dictyostelium discoideum AX4]|uniref:UBC core domain-containing protein n=1 Tax=Dictyostelium discoideum TaxID=44689 RepID=Q54FR5_DICDI|nr:hypothetical protein DDB_G0290629 [Dictyostelium discoideum AX4]EAL62175.1 hypothetical protein DDB_G0290629 [Dictyostelium discoideum AX4]|eukprot:XP_635702.1 hypothetical protein DDB_G0290629 [Dictyostelium discoideum AX4]